MRCFAQAFRSFAAIASIAVAVAGCASLPAGGSKQQFVLAVFSSQTPEAERKLDRWPDDGYLADLLTVPGFRSAQRYFSVKADTPTSELPRYLVFYRIETSGLAATKAEVRRRAESNPLVRGPASEDKGPVTIFYKPLRPAVHAREVPGSSAPTRIAGRDLLKKFSLMVLSNATQGREAEYDEWYDNQHVPDVLRIPGFATARRYVLDSVVTAGVIVPHYMVLFDFESYDLDATIDDLKLRNRTGLTKMSPAFDSNGVHVYYLSPLPNARDGT